MFSHLHRALPQRSLKEKWEMGTAKLFFSDRDQNPDCHRARIQKEKKYKRMRESRGDEMFSALRVNGG